jgi:hypothetical protein
VTLQVPVTHLRFCDTKYYAKQGKAQIKALALLGIQAKPSFEEGPSGEVVCC